MIDLSTLEQPSELFELLSLVLRLSIALVVLPIILFFILVTFQEMIDEKQRLKNKLPSLIVLIGLFVLSFNVMTTDFGADKKDSQLETISEALENNIFLFLSINEDRTENDSMTLKEIEEYILLHPEYFTTDSLRKKDMIELERIVKKYVYDNYKRNNPIYQELILESKRMFQ